MGKLIDITGRKFLRLTVISRAPNRNKEVMWKCVCKCGTMIITSGHSLRRKDTRSCGCFQKETSHIRGKLNTHHGMSRQPEYNSWRGIRDRCLNPRDGKYKWYGGRGITICEQWFQSFENFFTDMGPKPHPKMTIERIDNNLGYNKENCTWATRTEQSRNRRFNVNIHLWDQTKCIAEWSRILNISDGTIRGRIKHGWEPIRAILTPSRWS